MALSNIECTHSQYGQVTFQTFCLPCRMNFGQMEWRVKDGIFLHETKLVLRVCLHCDKQVQKHWEQQVQTLLLAEKLLSRLGMDGRVFSADWRSLHMCRNQYCRAVTSPYLARPVYSIVLHWDSMKWGCGKAVQHDMGFWIISSDRSSLCLHASQHVNKQFAHTRPRTANGRKGSCVYGLYVYFFDSLGNLSKFDLLEKNYITDAGLALGDRF